MKIKITKLSELEDALHKNNIEEGYEQIYEIEERYFEEPTIDRRFNVSEFSSSGVQKIIDKNTFRTHNSIYRWEILETDYEKINKSGLFNWNSELQMDVKLKMLEFYNNLSEIEKQYVNNFRDEAILDENDICQEANL